MPCKGCLKSVFAVSDRFLQSASFHIIITTYWPTNTINIIPRKSQMQTNVYSAICRRLTSLINGFQYAKGAIDDTLSVDEPWPFYIIIFICAKKMPLLAQSKQQSPGFYSTGVKMGQGECSYCASILCVNTAACRQADSTRIRAYEDPPNH